MLGCDIDIPSQGNACFQKQDFKAAITHYTKAIDFDPSNAVFFINRAMAYLKLQMYVLCVMSKILKDSSMMNRIGTWKQSRIVLVV